MTTTALALPMRGLILFPGMVRAFPITRPGEVQAVRRHLTGEAPLVLVPQVDPGTEDVLHADLATVGVELRVEQLVELPNGTLRLLAHALPRVQRVGPLSQDADGAYRLEVGAVPPTDEASTHRTELAALAAEASGVHREWLLGTGMSDADHDLLMVPPDEPERLSDQMSGVVELSWPEQLSLLQTTDPADRFRQLIQVLTVAIARQRIQADIQDQVQAAMDKNQREFHIKEQIKALRAELGQAVGGDAEADAFLERVEAANLPEEARAEAEREIERMRHTPAESAEYNIARTWLETLLDVPWHEATDDLTGLDRAEAILDADHHALLKAKERILEYLAVRQLRDDAKGAVLCFVGAPGVGKTSLGRSIAKALGRNFTRISLGGIKDEAEIRGHRRTYVGAMPGRLVRGLIRAGSKNPVIVLDEIDKLGNDFRGDPASALLEVLDPEQNTQFVDHYLDVPIDLSQVLFVATANQADPIPHALHDRFEVLELPGYTEEEKVVISRRFLLPRLADEHGLDREHIRFDTNALLRLIREYTREAGLRDLNRQLAALFRKVARKVVSGKLTRVRITEASIPGYLGPARFLADLDDRDETPGVVIGLAWTASGGDILFLEALAMPGTAGLKLTGSLGEVMKESAEAALSWLKAHHASLGLEPSAFDQLLHLHVPAGAIPKDGPSAGVSMVTALASRLTGRPVRERLAMTGEITLRGKVLAVGGIKEKVLAARRAGVHTLVLPKHNEKDLHDIPAAVRRDLTIHLVQSVHEVLDLALTPA